MLTNPEQAAIPLLPRLVVLISGSGSNLQAIMDAIATGKLAARIACVISNRPNVYGLERAQAAGLDTQVVDHKAFANREAFDHALKQTLDMHQPDLVILAGFMRILTPAFVEHFQGRMLNIHPSLLPLYRGMHTHDRVLADGGREHGASVHFVTPDLDGGPVIIQARVPVLPSDNASTLAARVLEQEHIIYPLAIHWFTQGRLKLAGQHILLDGKILHSPVQHLNP